MIDDGQEPATVRISPTHPKELSLQTTAAIETPEQALAHIKAHRIRGLMLSSTIASIVAGVLVLFVMSGHPDASRLHAYSLFASAVASGLYVVIFRDPRRFNVYIAMTIVIAQFFVMITGYHYWGVFSAYAAIVPLTIYVASDGTESDKAALFITGIAVVAQSVFALATVFDWVETRSLVDVVRGNRTNEVVAIGLVGMIAFGAVLLGREQRQRTRSILDEHKRALRALALREAQLAEAQAEVADARRAGEGGAGRFTDQNIGGFLLGEVLGRGTMGEVYAATRASDNMPCAVKLLASHLLRDAEAHDRFQRESAMLLSLQSDHVVRVFAVSTGDQRQPFLAMERLVGVDLAQVLKERPILPLPEVADIVRQIATGLDAAHAAGVIHRDLKPQNLFAAGPEHARTWKIIDFGIGKWSDSDGALTKDQILGTPGYMAPEQALGRDVTARGDIYSLGVILYRLVTGVPVVRPGDVPAMLHEVVYKVPQQPSQVTDVPPQVEAVIAVALAKDPADRFASAGELARALDDASGARLDRAVGDRAARVIAKTPWGTWIER